MITGAERSAVKNMVEELGLAGEKMMGALLTLTAAGFGVWTILQMITSNSEIAWAAGMMGAAVVAGITTRNVRGGSN